MLNTILTAVSILSITTAYIFVLIIQHFKSMNNVLKAANARLSEENDYMADRIEKTSVDEVKALTELRTKLRKDYKDKFNLHLS